MRKDRERSPTRVPLVTQCLSDGLRQRGTEKKIPEKQAQTISTVGSARDISSWGIDGLPLETATAIVRHRERETGARVRSTTKRHENDWKASADVVAGSSHTGNWRQQRQWQQRRE